MPKDIGGLLAAKLRDPNLAKAHYLKMVWGAPTGTKRWTTYVNPKTGAQFDARDIDGSVQNWDSAGLFTVPELEENDQTALSISTIEFENADKSFSDRMTLSAGGLKAVAATLWTAFFDKFDLVTFDSKFLRFVGVFDRAEVGKFVKVELLAGKALMYMMFPPARFNAAHGYPWIPPANLKYFWGSGNYSVPAPTQQQTGNGAGGGSDVPPPGAITGIPRARPIRVDRGDRAPSTVDRPGGGGNVPRVITR